MSADKRSVSTDALETLGTIIGENEKRDAIHLAVIPVYAGEALFKGQDVGLGKDGLAYGPGHKPWGADIINPLGIVDPFLESHVTAGQRFWLVIYPRRITSLRHVWTHPDIPDDEEPVKATAIVDEKSHSEAWLRAFAEERGPDYEELIAAAARNDDDDYLHMNVDAYGDIPDQFWDHMEIVTGRRLTRAKAFSCSC